PEAPVHQNQVGLLPDRAEIAPGRRGVILPAAHPPAGRLGEYRHAGIDGQPDINVDKPGHRAAALFRQFAPHIADTIRVTVDAHQGVDEPIRQDARATTAILQIVARSLQLSNEVAERRLIEVGLVRHIDVTYAVGEYDLGSSTGINESSGRNSRAQRGEGSSSHCAVILCVKSWAGSHPVISPSSNLCARTDSDGQNWLSLMCEYDNCHRP